MEFKFDEKIIDDFSSILENLKGSKPHAIRAATNSVIHSYFDNKGPTPGIYSITDCTKYLYIGRSKNIAQRVGSGHRSLGKNAANLNHRISKQKGISPKEARDYIYENFYVRMIKMEDENKRAVFEVYASMELETCYNSFMEH